MGDNTGPADDAADTPDSTDDVPDDADLDRLMADADPDLAAPGEPQPDADPVEAAQESDTNRVKQELDLSNPDSEAAVDQFDAAEPFEPDGPIDPDTDIRDPRIREAVKQAQQAEQNQAQDQPQSTSSESDDTVATEEPVEADPETPVRVDNTKKPTTDTTDMSDSDPDREPVQNSEPATPTEMEDERYQSDDAADGGPTDPFDGSDDEVAEAMADWSELTTADEIDPDTFDFEDQDFEQIKGYGDEAVIPFNGIYFHLKKPDDDAAQSIMAKMQTVRDQGKMFNMVIEEVVEQPEMSARLESWDFWTRAGLAGRCMQFLGLDDMGEF